MLLYDRINQAVFAAKRNTTTFALLAIGLDGFKQINDSLGHRCGDVVLQCIATRLLEAVRESDTVARPGGDEFVVLLAGAGRPAAHKMAGRLDSIIRQAIEIDGTALTIGASVGAATYPTDGVTTHSLLSAADQAMYRVKNHANQRR